MVRQKSALKLLIYLAELSNQTLLNSKAAKAALLFAVSNYFLLLSTP